MNKPFLIAEKTVATADPRMDNETLRNLWRGFTLTVGALSFEKGEPCTFRLGNTPLPPLPEGKEYALRVDEQGAAVIGKDYGGLMRGVFSLMMKIECQEERLMIKAVAEESAYTIRNRMLHICVFPENDLYFIKKLIRLAAVCQYTHLVIEFWGMLQYDCLKELAWPHAFTKEQAEELIQECRDLGIEPIPMFNQLGHASGCRIKYGKHVVLDQNPRLQHLFTPDGWAWNIESPAVKALLKAVRKELYDLFGQGEYIHIGCDEAYFYTHCDEKRKLLPAFLKELTDAVAAEGRRPMVWMDMMLERDKYNQKVRAYATCAPEEVELLQGSLNPATVMVDWQYEMTEAPIEPLLSLKGNIRDAMGAPWFEPKNYAAYAKTIADHGFFGIMMTTWHTLKEKMPCILGCAKECGAVTFPWSACGRLDAETASLLRRLSFEGNTYADSGWSKEQIEV